MTLRQQWIDSLRNNPVMLKDIVIAGAMLGAAYGLDMTAEQLALITSFVMALWSPLVRNQVTTLRRPRLDSDTPLVPAANTDPIV